ncbi:hypothetical protein ACFX59_06445 [Sphingomonas sp. NCPPB 2930]|uniref:hypothetical protein n=1 Tax=Sphingomonas sp. NCPPB 2930 TaxID=3162788 RepID=UPI0036DCB40E
MAGFPIIVRMLILLGLTMGSVGNAAAHVPMRTLAIPMTMTATANCHDAAVAGRDIAMTDHARITSSHDPSPKDGKADKAKFGCCTVQVPQVFLLGSDSFERRGVFALAIFEGYDGFAVARAPRPLLLRPPILG